MRPWTDTIDPATIPDDILYSELGRRRAAARINPTGGARKGAGRPQSAAERCYCGAMTRKRAEARSHHCAPDQPDR